MDLLPDDIIKKIFKYTNFLTAFENRPDDIELLDYLYQKEKRLWNRAKSVIQFNDRYRYYILSADDIYKKHRDLDIYTTKKLLYYLKDWQHLQLNFRDFSTDFLYKGAMSNTDMIIKEIYNLSEIDLQNYRNYNAKLFSRQLLSNLRIV